jgi:replication-associated recombination protein RarA
MKTTTIYQQWAPQSLAEVRGQDVAIAEIRGIADTVGLGGQALWLVGGSGRGKSLIAGLVARELADEWCVVEMDAGRLTANMVDNTIMPMMHTLPLGERSGKVLILEEAHGLKGDAMRRLLVLLEHLPSHSTLIFTTTIEGQGKLYDEQLDASPLLSRCFRINITGQGLKRPVAEWLKMKAAESGLDGHHPLSWFEQRMEDSKNNVRAAIQDTVRLLAREKAQATV